MKLSIKIVWSFRLSSAFRIASTPFLCGICRYNRTTSVQRIKSSGKSRSSLSFFKKSFVSFINNSTFCDNGFKWYSKKAEMFYVKNPLLEITGLPGTLCSRLWVLGNRQNLPSFGLFMKKYFEVSLGISPLFLTRERQPFTILIKGLTGSDDNCSYVS